VHVVQDVSARVAGKSQVTLTLRTRCLATRSSAAVIQMLFTYWDDVVLFGFETANGDFESSASSAWNYSENGSSWDGRRYTGDLRSGYACYRIMYPSNSCTVNDSGQISQAVTNNAPLILSAMPGGTTVAVQSPVTVAFSEAMEKEAAQTAFCLSPSVAGSFAWQGNTMVFTPAVSLQPAATYTVTVTTGARDQAGLGMAAAHAWQFSTGTSVPELSIVSPADGSLVSGMATIQAEASDPAGITKVDFYVDGLRERTLTAPPFSWEWDSGAVSIGTHSIRVVATGTGGGSTEKTITVRTLGPENENEIVYPNPYINGKSASPGKIFFSHLTGNCTVRIYTVSGGLIATIAHRQGAANTEEWDISGVAGGIYLYSITDGKTTVKGKIGIIK
jgi:hypothetical protein